MIKIHCTNAKIYQRINKSIFKNYNRKDKGHKILRRKIIKLELKEISTHFWQSMSAY